MADQEEKYYLVEYWNEGKLAHKFFALICSEKEFKLAEIADCLSKLAPDYRFKIVCSSLEELLKALEASKSPEKTGRIQ